MYGGKKRYGIIVRRRKILKGLKIRIVWSHNYRYYVFEDRCDRLHLMFTFHSSFALERIVVHISVVQMFIRCDKNNIHRKKSIEKSFNQILLTFFFDWTTKMLMKLTIIITLMKLVNKKISFSEFCFDLLLLKHILIFI